MSLTASVWFTDMILATLAMCLKHLSRFQVDWHKTLLRHSWLAQMTLLSVAEIAEYELKH